MEKKAQHSIILWTLIVLVLIIVSIAGVGTYLLSNKEEIIQGQIESAEYRVSSKIPGRIHRILVHEGDQVKAGDTLAILEAPEVTAKLAQAKAVQEAADAIREKADNGARKEQVQAAFEMWQKAKAGLEIAEKSYNRINRLYEDGVMSAQKRDEVYANFKAMEATEKAAKAQYDMARNGAQKEDREAAKAKALQAQGVVEEVNSYIRETIVIAPMDGVVSEIFPYMGELVGTGAPIMNICMPQDTWAVFNVREDLLKELCVGNTFTAYIPAFDREIKLKVTSTKDMGSYAAWKATKTTGQFDLKTFEVKAELSENIKGLRPGMSVIIKK